MIYSVFKIKERERVNYYNPFTSNYGGFKAKDIFEKINDFKDIQKAKKYINDNKGYYDEYIIIPNVK